MEQEPLKFWPRVRRLPKRTRKLFPQVDSLIAKVEELEARLSVVEGRSQVNAERVVRTHASVQNVAEDMALHHPVQHLEDEEE